MSHLLQFLPPRKPLSGDATSPLTRGNVSKYRYEFSNPQVMIDDGHGPVWKDHKGAIKRAAESHGIDPVLLATVIQQEGFGRTKWARRAGLVFRSSEHWACMTGRSIGPGQMKVKNVLALNGGSKTAACNALAFPLDDEFAIAKTAQMLSYLQSKFGLSDREAFIAYQAVPVNQPGEARAIRNLRSTKFSGRSGKPRGKQYDRLNKSIRKNWQ